MALANLAGSLFVTVLTLGAEIGGVGLALQLATNDLVAELTSAVNLSVRREMLPDPPLETWLGDHFIARIPGATDAT